ncbi:MAG TPA: DUF2157 domain-containing protein [Burkholderiales bacterium]|nr:DUF2157 domain-containing protein [Burkholderiales bacterium]
MSERATILSWTEHGAIDDAQAALSAAGVLPSARHWRTFLDRLLLWSGAAALGVAVVFFIAYNWSALGRYAKFGLLQIAIVAAVVAYWRLGPERASAKAALLVACIVLGALLALVGQTYQTGADTFELFAAWGALIVPWVIVGRYAALWVMWLALANLAAALYFSTFGGWLGFVFTGESPLWLLFALNTLALAVWELAATRIDWLASRWAPRVIAVASGVAVAMLALHAVLDGDAGDAIAVLAYATWLACGGYVYVRLRRDLFMLAGGCLSAIVVVTAFLGRHLFALGGGAGAALLIALAVIGMAAASGWWLRQLAAESAE